MITSLVLEEVIDWRPMKYNREANVNYLIQKLKHGYNLLSMFKGFSPSPFHNLVAGVLGVGVGITALYMSWLDVRMVPWVSDRRDSSEIVTVAGLQNLGNNCFLNVILQALSSSSYFLPSLQNILVTDDPLIEEKAERMPLAVALISLLEELCIVRDERTVLNPRRVMLVMGLYVSNFNLTRQQDAAEAFLHLLSSLEEESSHCYVRHGGSLADIAAFPSKIYKPKREGQNECARWQKQFFGPFNGTIGNVLTCTNCSSTLSMDFEFFRCLPLSPVLDGSADIMNGCTVVDCLKHFTAVEVVENYRCSRCWHNAALKYFSLKTEKDEAKIKMLLHCVKLDSCDCKNLFLQEEVTWTGFSCALKQLSIARCPKILCIHLQRAFMSEHGESIKLQGHISFPLFLDLFPFMEGAATVGRATSEKNMQKQGMRQKHPVTPQLIHLNMQREMQMLPHLYRIVGESLSPEDMSGNNLGRSICESSRHPSIETGDYNRDTVLRSRMVGSDLYRSQAYSQNEAQVSNTGCSTSPKNYIYCLSSVVEHYGRPGSGHYAVYRRVASESGAGISGGPSETLNWRWFYVSDREVSIVSEETVLAAEASLLFYERIESCL